MAWWISKALLCMAFCGLAGVGHAQDTRAGDEAQRKTLVVHSALGMPGLHEVVEGRAVGLYPELLALVARRAGFNLDLRSGDWPKPVEAVRQGSGDVLGPLMGQPSAFTDLLHSESLMRVEFARYVRHEDVDSRKAMAFQGVKLAVLSESFGSRWLSREHPLAQQVPVDTLEGGLNALSTGQVDAFIALKLPVRRVIESLRIQGIQEVGIEITTPMTLAFSPSARDKLPAINEAIAGLIRDGETERLRDRWMPPSPPSVDEQRLKRLVGMLMASLLLLVGVLALLVRSNRRLKSATLEAQQSRRAKGDFLAVMSHEIRTPINGLVNLIDLLRRTGTTPEQADLLGKAEHANRALLTLVNQVLDYSKIEAAQVELQPRPSSLDTLLQQVHAVLSALPRSADVALVLESPRAELPLLMMDEARLSQVLVNLGSNALKFTSRGRVRLRVEVLSEPDRSPGSRQVRFEMEDTGPGIPEDQMPRLFRPFSQLHTGYDRPHQGTGLGLSTSAELVRLMGSRIQVQSTPGQTTRFWFDLTLSEAPDRNAPAVPAGDGPGPGNERPPVQRAAAPSSSTSSPGWIGRLLVVDDNALNLLVTRRILEQEGWEVAEASNAEQALQRLTQDDGPLPDVILLDLHMPGQDGLQAMSHFKKLLGARLPPVLAVSGAVTEESTRAVREAGMVGFVPKPFVRHTLLEAIHKARNTAGLRTGATAS